MRVTWQLTPTKSWEYDWLEYLMQHHAHTHDDNWRNPADKTVLVLNDLATDTLDVIRAYDELGYSYGVILLSDEYLRWARVELPGASFMYRNYYTPEAPTGVKFFPLGYKQGFWDTEPQIPKVTDRPYHWSFAGAPNKSDRVSMLYNMSALELPHLVHITSYWASPDCLSTANYRKLLTNSVYIPSPCGNASADCFRTWEALEAGAIPIVPYQSGVQQIGNYYHRLVEASGFHVPPFPVVQTWEDVRTVTQDPVATQKACLEWWAEYKAYLVKDFTQTLEKL